MEAFIVLLVLFGIWLVWRWIMSPPPLPPPRMHRRRRRRRYHGEPEEDDRYAQLGDDAMEYPDLYPGDPDYEELERKNEE